jgi:hypothetical protein
MMSFFVGALITAVLLKAVTSVIPVVEIDDWVPAIIVGVIVSVVGLATGMLTPALTAQGVGVWPIIAILNVVSVLVLALAIAIVPGIKSSGAMAVILTAILVQALGYALSVAYVQAMTIGVRP